MSRMEFHRRRAEQEERQDELDQVQSNIEEIAEQGVEKLMESLGWTNKKAYKEVKKLLQSVAKYGF